MATAKGNASGDGTPAKRRLTRTFPPIGPCVECGQVSVLTDGGYCAECPEEGAAAMEAVSALLRLTDACRMLGAEGPCWQARMVSRLERITNILADQWNIDTGRDDG